jgi:hypothetical protein
MRWFSMDKRRNRLNQMEAKGYLTLSSEQREKNLKKALDSLKILFLETYRCKYIRG